MAISQHAKISPSSCPFSGRPVPELAVRERGATPLHFPASPFPFQEAMGLAGGFVAAGTYIHLALGWGVVGGIYFSLLLGANGGERADGLPKFG